MNLKTTKFLAGAGLGAALGWTFYQLGWIVWQVSRRDVQRTLAVETNRGQPGVQFEQTIETGSFTRVHLIEDGIERVSYYPKTRRFDTPLLLQHGMWQGAWVWQQWQEIWAAQGWESHAHSLPGHAGSPEQHPIALCTMDYYLSFLKREAERLPRPPVLVGHSLGGGLAQWYLKYVGDLPAAVLVTPVHARSALRYGAALIDSLKLDPLGLLLTWLTRKTKVGSRSPASAAKMLITPGAIYSPEELYGRLSPDSMLTLYQHNPPFWRPPARVNTPLLWLAGELDAAVPEPAERESAAHYGAAYRVIPNAGHNLMMEHNYRDTAELIHTWLVAQGIS